MINTTAPRGRDVVDLQTLDEGEGAGRDEDRDALVGVREQGSEELRPEERVVFVDGAVGGGSDLLLDSEDTDLSSGLCELAHRHGEFRIGPSGDRGATADPVPERAEERRQRDDGDGCEHRGDDVGE